LSIFQLIFIVTGCCIALEASGKQLSSSHL